MSASHQLQNTWVIWELKDIQRDENYSQALKEVCEFTTVEDFWRYWSFIPKPSEVFGDGNGKKIVDGRTIKAFSLFKKGIKPTWEDPLNAAGSELTAIRAFNLEVLDVLWENLIFGLIGEVIEDSDDICGVRVVDQMKKAKVSYKLEIWLKTQDEVVCSKIRSRLGDILMEGESAKPGSRIRVPEFDLSKRTGGQR